MEKDKRLNRYISMGSVFVSISTATGYFLDNVSPISYWGALDFLLWISYSGILFLITRFLINIIVRKIADYNIKNIKIKGNINYWKYGLIAFAIILICYIIVWLSYYPGLWNYDPEQTYEVVNNQFGCHHPLVHTLLLGGCYILGCRIGSPNLGVVIYDWIQMLIMAGIFAYICTLILKNLRLKWAYAVSVIFYAIVPFHAFLAISSTKDVLFSGLVLLSASFLCQYFYSEASKGLTVALSISIPMMLLFRNNASYAYGMFIAIAIVAALKKIISYKKVSFLVVLFVVYYIINSLLVNMLHAESVDLRETASIPSIQMGRLYYYDIANEDDRKSISEYIDVTKAEYSPYLADSMKGYLYIDQERDLANVFAYSLKLFVKYPRASLDAILYLHEGAWYLGDISHSRVYGEGLESRQGYLLSDIKEGYGITLDSKIPFLEELFERLFSNNEYQKNPILKVVLSPAFYNWILFGCILALSYQRKYKEVLISLFLICLMITILLGPCTIIRYFYPIAVCVPLVISWTISPFDRK